MGLSDLRRLVVAAEEGSCRCYILVFPCPACGGYVSERRWGVEPTRMPRAVW